MATATESTPTPTPTPCTAAEANRSAHGTSHVGRRENNEDSFRVCDDIGLYLVADGMGGHEGGEVASQVVADTVAEFVANATTAVTIGADDDVARGRRRLSQAIALARDEIGRRAVGELAEMGTTLAALLMRDTRAIVAHVGDSRVYRLRAGFLEQLTKDHSFVAELRAAGVPDLMASLPDEFSAMVTRCIALECNSEPDFLVLEVEAGDVFLLCSDGLTDALSNERIGEVLGGHTDPQLACRELNRLAFEHGSQDNITSVVVFAH